MIHLVLSASMVTLTFILLHFLRDSIVSSMDLCTTKSFEEIDMPETQYRIYPDNTVVHEDEFEEVDHMQPYSDDYRTVSVPDAVVDFIAESFAVAGAAVHV